MEREQVLIQLDRFEFRRFRIGRGRLPFQKLLRHGECRAGGIDLKRIFSLRARLFARTVKRERIEREEVEQRRPIRIG